MGNAITSSFRGKPLSELSSLAQLDLSKIQSILKEGKKTFPPAFDGAKALCSFGLDEKNATAVWKVCQLSLFLALPLSHLSPLAPDLSAFLHSFR
jgi:hypothetical protein